MYESALSDEEQISRPVLAFTFIKLIKSIVLLRMIEKTIHQRCRASCKESAKSHPGKIKEKQCE
jgi:hypothetical protein